MRTEGETLRFRDISRISIPIISGTNKDTNLDFIPLESPCDSEQNRPSPDFYNPFPDYDPKTTSTNFGPVEWEIAC